MSAGALQALIATALEHHKAGRLAEAEQIYREILAADPHHADSLQLLAMIEFQTGHYEMAADLIRRAIAVDEAQPAWHANLGTILQAQGKPGEAVASYERALALRPNLVEALINLGNVLQEQGRPAEAAARYERAIELKPDCAEAFYNLGNVHLAEHRVDDAIACQQKAVALRPDYTEAHNNLGIALAEQGRSAEAISHYERAIELHPDNARAHMNLGVALATLDRTTEAVGHFEHAIALNPNIAEAHNDLANILKAQGRFDDALVEYARALAIRPDYAEAHYNRSEITSFRHGDAELRALEELVAGGHAAPEKAVYLHFALAKALEDTGDYERAFEHLRAGNALKRAQIDYDEAATLARMRHIAEVFDRGLLDRLGGQGDPSEVPIFVLGMPRSGSTLIEQIIASHPDVHGAGELAFLENTEHPALSGPALCRFGRDYLDTLPNPDGKLRVVDKLPGNFLNIGLIRLILPNAKIIHTVRDPIDTCVSCYSRLFPTSLAFTYDLGELGRYYRAYRDLMAHWRTVVPVLDVVYEEVVEDLERQARRLIEYCGLRWDPCCLEFHRTRRTVKTASAVQVRQPLFRSSVERWRRYEAGLAPLLRELR